ncbi:uncharacterized protein LOC62_05G007035 [Vanrija pseudolonga]|uniref:Uncharacterized protein n=1 Tax=Vanrija pseudolonga TaxID=143232 RepID=A0AAF1BK42_9TREE|nr:hypothetical protein LOC62_05G007035 [Vanrija pseudolonga]
MRSLPLLLGLAVAQRAAAFVFTVDGSTVNECGQTQFNWTAGTPPYYITAIADFDTSVNQSIPDSAINSNGGGSYQWTMPYNAGNRTVFIMSDATGFATGGASLLYTVGPRPSGASCQLRNSNVAWTFDMQPGNNNLPQCGGLSFTWTNQAVGPVTFTGVIPGGQVLQWTASGGKTTYNVNIRSGTQVLFAGWDSRGNQGGTSALQTVTSGNSNCINNDSPSSTPVQWTPTSTVGAPTDISSSSKKPTTTSASHGVIIVTETALASGGQGLSTGAIVGIAIGAVVVVCILQAIIVWCCCRRRVSEHMASRRAQRARAKLSKAGDVDLYDRRGSNYPSENAAAWGQRWRDDEAASNVSPFIPAPNRTSGLTSGHWESNTVHTSLHDPFNPPPMDTGYDLSARPSFTDDRTSTNEGSTLPPGAGYGSQGHARDEVYAGRTAESTHGGRGNESAYGGRGNESSYGGRGNESAYGGYVAGSSSSSSGRQAAALPPKSALALAALNPDPVRQSFQSEHQPPLEAPPGGFRRHEDAGSLTPTSQDALVMEDLPPTYDPDWHK